MADNAATVYRDYVTDGVPSSGANKPKKSEIRKLLAGYEQIINAFISGGGLIYASKAALDADLAKAANSMAWVMGDATVANNGVYRKNGASGSGSWTRVADLPYSFIIASDVGAGTPNAIQATTSLPVSGSALVWLNVFEANSGTPVTVSFNGGPTLTIKTNAGNNVAAGGLVAGTIVLGVVSGGTFRLVSDQAGAAVLAACEAAQAAAEAAAAGINIRYVADRAALKAVNTTAAKLAYLGEPGREGQFQFVSGDFSANVAVDTQEGIWIKSDSVASSLGCWERVDKQELDIRWFGADASAADNKLAIQAAFNVASGFGYSGFRAPLVLQETYFATGGMYTRGNLHVKGRNGGGFKAKVGGYSGTGAFITNVSTVAAERAVDNVWFDGVVIDLSLITYEGNTTNSENCLGFARGASNVKVTNCLLKGAAPNFNIVSGGVGGKGLNMDGGVRGAIVYGNRFEGNYQGWSIRANEGEFTSGDGKEQVTKIIGFGNHFEDNMIALCLNGRDANEDPDMDAADMMVEIYASTAKNNGFCPGFKASNSNRYKSGIIMAGEAQNVLIDGFRSYNDPDYITQKGGWPTTGDVIGQGLSGPIGAVLYGWGGNCQFRNIVHNGDVDQLAVLGRAYAIGDDAAPTRSIVCNKFDVEIHHVGSCINLVRQDMYDQVSSSSNATGHWRIRPDVVTGALIHANSTNLVGHVLEVLQDDGGGRGATGSFKWFSKFTTSLASKQSQKVGFESISTDGLNIGGGTAVMTNLLVFSGGHDFGTVNAHATGSQTFSVPGVATGAGKFVIITSTGTYPVGIVFDGQVTGANTVTIFAINTTAANIAVGSRTYGIMVLDATPA